MKDYQPLLIGIGIVLGVAYLARQSGEAIENFNEGTDFEGTGVIGALGNATDRASGGILSRFGSFLGRTAADVVDAVTGRTGL